MNLHLSELWIAVSVETVSGIAAFPWEVCLPSLLRSQRHSPRSPSRNKDKPYEFLSRDKWGLLPLPCNFPFLTYGMH